jgi:hypothetical protein
MTNPWTFWMDAARFGWDAQQVIAMRMERVGTGKSGHQAELQKMVTEKTQAFIEAQFAYATALMTGASPMDAWAKAETPYRKRVRANHRRLSRLD